MANTRQNIIDFINTLNENELDNFIEMYNIPITTKEIVYEYEMFISSEENDVIQINEWINMSYNAIKNKEKISEYIQRGILRIKNIDTTKIPIIYGVILNRTSFGYQALSIDGNTGEIIDAHFCSSENFAKSDLGFTDPYMLQWDLYCNDKHSTVSFNKERKKKYLERYKDDYNLEWIGHYSNNKKVTKLLELNNML